MSDIVNGTFVFQCDNCEHHNSIPAADADFDCVSETEGKMGPERLHQWIHTHECSNCDVEAEIDYQISEYPEGVFNSATVNVDPGKALQEFGYDFSDGPEPPDDRPEGLEITVKHYIPQEIITEFGDEIQSDELKTNFYTDTEEFFNFTGSEVADFIIAGLLLPAAYDMIKTGVVGLWKKLDKAKEADKDGRITRHISLRLESEDGKIVVLELKGDIKNKTIEKIVDEAFEFLKPETKEKLFSNKDFVSTSNPGNIPTVILLLNEDTGKWEPWDIGAANRDMQRMRDDSMKWDS